MEKTLIPKGVSTRPRRTPITQRNRLSVKNPDPNFEYRIVNDVDDRVEILMEQGYVIDNEAKVGSKRVDDASPLGATSTISVGKGVRAVVMKQRKDWYIDDQELKQKTRVDALENQMKSDAKKASDYGSLEVSRN